MRRLLVAQGLVLALTASATISAQSSAASITPVAASGVSITVSCHSNPERVTVRNNRSRAITVASVGSIYKPRSNEPFYVYDRVGAGRSITYTFGQGRGSHRLTRAYIFNNDVGEREGARVRTPLGAITDRC
jgi:hypothetical protein